MPIVFTSAQRYLIVVFELLSTKINVYGSNNSGFKTYYQYKQLQERGGLASVTFKRYYES